LQDGDFEEAYRGFSEVADRALDPVLRKGARYNAGNAAYGAGKLEDALSAWERVIEADPEFEPAQRNAEAVRQEIAQRLQETPPEQDPSDNSDEGEDSEDSEPEDSDSSEDSENQDSESGESEEGEEGEREPPAQEEQNESGEMPELAEGEADEPPSNEAPLVEGVQEMTEEEAMRLLEGVEEGRPYVVVGGESSENDW
jgi:Ca-activated chloride channel family protein